MENQISRLRCNVSSDFVRKAKEQAFKIRDENIVIFSHQLFTTVSAPFRIRSSKEQQPIIFLYLEGVTGSSVSDGFYTIKGVINEKELKRESFILVNSEGMEVQGFSIDIEKHDRPSKSDVLEITDGHIVSVDVNIVSVEISGTYGGFSFRGLIEVEY